MHSASFAQDGPALVSFATRAMQLLILTIKRRHSLWLPLPSGLPKKHMLCSKI